MFKKIAANDAFAVLSAVPGTLRAQQEKISQLSSENQKLREKVASYVLRDRVEKVAKDMEAKGLEVGLSHKERLDMLQKKAGEGKLDVVEQAIDLAATQNPLGSVSDLPSAGGDLVSYLLGED
ncbi:MAG: hypothetical protein ACFFD4_39855 [Candidatus Odinarchaeota archaeon]